MSETNSNEGASEGDLTGAAGTGTSADGATGTQAPEGFVPQAELDALREEFRRSLQSERDKLLDELDRRTAASASSSDDAGAAATGATGETLTQADVARIMSVTTALPALRQEFPHADPAFFEPDHALGYRSIESLRLAAKASHDRVAGLIGPEVEKQVGALRAEMEQKYGSGAGSANGGGESGGTGDPTPAQLSNMTMDELDALEKQNPGVLDRVLRSALST